MMILIALMKEYLPAALIEGEDADFDNEQPNICDQTAANNCCCIECILQFIKKTEVRLLKYHNVLKLYEFVAMLSSTQVKCERNFSKMKLIKNLLRSNLCEKQLQNLMIIFTEAAILEKIEVENIIEEIAKISRLLSEKLL